MPARRCAEGVSLAQSERNSLDGVLSVVGWEQRAGAIQGRTSSRHPQWLHRTKRADGNQPELSAQSAALKRGQWSGELKIAIAAHVKAETQQAQITTHRLQLIELARRRGIGNVRVFGSMARDDAGDSSDVDLLVTLPPGCSGLALGGLLMDAQDLLGRPVDVVTEDVLHPALRAHVLASAVALSSPAHAGRGFAMCWCTAIWASTAR